MHIIQKILSFRNRRRIKRIFKGLPYDISHKMTKKTLITLIVIAFVAYYLSLNATFVGKHVEKNVEKYSTDFTVDYFALLCGTKEFKQDTRETTEKSFTQTYDFTRPIKPEFLNKANDVERQLVTVAKRISSDSHMVLFTLINDAYLPFAYNWLCNTRPMDIHRSVLIVTTDKQSKSKLDRDWPNINVISLDMGNLGGIQSYNQVGYIKITVKRTEMIQSLLMANIDVFVFEVDCLWLADPVPGISLDQRDDIIVNPVAGTNDVFESGFIWLRNTCKAKVIWQKVTDLMVALRKKIEDLPETSVFKTYEEENEQKYLTRLIRDGYANVTIKMLPLGKYADGKWYQLTETKRSKMHPDVINNNWIIGNKAKIESAKTWNHWFVREDYTCDIELVYKTIY